MLEFIYFCLCIILAPMALVTIVLIGVFLVFGIHLHKKKHEKKEDDDLEDFLK